LRSFRVLAALLLLAPLVAQAQYSIASVTFRHADPYAPAELLAVSGLKPGQLLNNDSLANAAQRLLNTGLFADATINYGNSARARAIVVDVSPIPLDQLLPASFENFVWFTPEELTAGIHAQVPLYRGVASDAGSLPDDIQAALQQMLAAKGITASISHAIAEPTNLQPHRVVNFSIDQPFVRLGTLHLSMVAPTGASATLSPGLQQAANAATRHPFNEGLTGINLSSILLDPFRRAGYVQASLDNIERTVAPAPADANANASAFLVTYTARIVTGDPYKISTLTWNPTPLYSAADFARDNKLHPGDLANESDLAKTEAAISKAYLLQGYLDVYVLSHPVPDATAHTVAYTFEPVPGEIYRLKTVNVTGLSPQALQQFNADWPMKPGDPYSDQAVNAFLAKHIAQPPFQPYGAGFKAVGDPATHEVDLTLTFTPNNPH
jgi:outer membrane protein insertion porin family